MFQKVFHLLVMYSSGDPCFEERLSLILDTTKPLKGLNSVQTKLLSFVTFDWFWAQKSLGDFWLEERLLKK